jgi:tetratricopeptide (TPR) repeat protein
VSCKKKIAFSLFICLVFTIFGLCPSANSAPRPLRKSELLTLVAGGIIPENIVYDIHSKGLAFVPDESYKALLKSAGADAQVLAALNTAKTSSPEKADSTSGTELLQHLSRAGNLINAGQLDAAANELAASLDDVAGKPEVGFVMGMILIKRQQWEEAGQVYSEILRRDPDFPEVHVRLSLTYYQSGDSQNALREAKAALAQNPNNPVAHMNAGLAMRSLRSFDAAKSELQLAIRCKPDYEPAYVNLGILLDELSDFDGAIAQYKKALTLKPDDINARYDLGVAYGGKGDFVSAIREYREVKRRDPNRFDARQNLGAALMKTDPAAAIAEFRELAALAPDFPVCHQCLGSALYRTGRYPEAEKEYRIAAELDPAAPASHTGIGLALEAQKKYDEALREYRKAEQLDSNFADAYTDAGRILLQKKDFPGAISELKRAEELDPTSWGNHGLRGRALEGSGDRDSAIAEYKEALSIAPKELQARLDLALALEKKGDWIAALANYRQAALDEPPPKMGIPQIRFDAEHKHQSAQQRFQQHLADLRSSGKSSEAAALEAQLHASEATPNLDEKFHAAMQSSVQAMGEKRLNDAETSAKQAIEFAEKIQPPDGRLPEALGQLGSVYAWRLDYKNAEDTYKRQFTLTERLYGPQSPMIAGALQNLAMLRMAEKDFAGAETFFTRALDLNQKTYGENSTAFADSLRGSTGPSMATTTTAWSFR